MLKKYALLIVLVYSVSLAVMSLIHISGTGGINFSHTDKVFHFVAYSALSWLWYNVFTFRSKWSKQKSLTVASILAIVFGIVIELLQSVFTRTRVAESNDILANILGVGLTIVLVLVLKKNKG